MAPRRARKAKKLSPADKKNKELTVKFARPKRTSSYTYEQKNETLQLATKKLRHCKSSHAAAVAAVLEMEARYPSIQIPVSTIDGLLKEGYDGKHLLAPRRGRPPKLDIRVEREVACRVSCI